MVCHAESKTTQVAMCAAKSVFSSVSCWYDERLLTVDLYHFRGFPINHERACTIAM